MSKRALVVSLHDVSPLTFTRCARIVEDLGRLGAAPLSLLVIPNHHERGHVKDDAGLCEWLRARATEGHEIVTHGYFHRRPRRPHETLMQRLTTRVYTAGEGEFYDLDCGAASRLVSQGNGELRALGLSPAGFIAPAWLLSDAAEGALRDLGAEYTTRLRTVHDLQRHGVEESQSLCWSVRAAWRRSVSLLWNAGLYRRLENSPLMRISVHPVDIEHPRIWAQIRALIADALRTREPMTYIDWINARRAAAAAEGPE